MERLSCAKTHRQEVLEAGLDLPLSPLLATKDKESRKAVHSCWICTCAWKKWQRAMAGRWVLHSTGPQGAGWEAHSASDKQLRLKTSLKTLKRRKDVQKL